MYTVIYQDFNGLDRVSMYKTTFPCASDMYTFISEMEKKCELEMARIKAKYFECLPCPIAYTLFEGDLMIIPEPSRIAEGTWRYLFVDAWIDAGGSVNDTIVSDPEALARPWLWAKYMIVRGTTPQEWGKSWYDQMKAENRSVRND